MLSEGETIGQDENMYSSVHRVVDYTQTKKYTFSDEHLKQRNIISGFAHDPRSTPYRELRTRVLQIMRSNNWRTLAITSPTKGNGKTLTALNLAISLSQEVNQTVLLVDMDLRRPEVANALGVDDVEAGVADCVLTGVSFESILITPGFNRLVIAPGTSQGHHTSEIISSPKMRELHQEIRSRYQDRIVVYDLPALLESDDALVFTPSVDATLLVVEDGGCTKTEIIHACKLLEDSNLIGTVINRSKV